MGEDRGKPRGDSDVRCIFVAAYEAGYNEDTKGS